MSQEQGAGDELLRTEKCSGRTGARTWPTTTSRSSATARIDVRDGEPPLGHALFQQQATEHAHQNAGPQPSPNAERSACRADAVRGAHWPTALPMSLSRPKQR